MDPATEPVEIVDEQDRVVEIVGRRLMRERNLFHRCTYVVVLDTRGRVYVHRRTETKDVYPGFYDVTAGGVNGVGETYDVCAARELEEELGICSTDVPVQAPVRGAGRAVLGRRVRRRLGWADPVAA